MPSTDTEQTAPSSVRRASTALRFAAFRSMPRNAVLFLSHKRPTAPILRSTRHAIKLSSSLQGFLASRTAENIRVFGSQRQFAILLSENGEQFQDITQELRTIAGRDRVLDEYLKSEGIYPHIL